MSRGEGPRGAHFASDAGRARRDGGSGKHFSASAQGVKRGDEVPASAEKDVEKDVEPIASDDDDFSSSGDYESVGRSARLMTGLIVVSRVTGFVRTWVMGVALGVSLLSTSYQVAQNLPAMLYDLVMGGMLVTAFLPVYMDVRRRRGKRGSGRDKNREKWTVLYEKDFEA